VTENLMACTCPHHVHRNTFCKHMAAVETPTDDRTLDAFTSGDDTEPEDCDCDGINGLPLLAVRANGTEGTAILISIQHLKQGSSIYELERFTPSDSSRRWGNTKTPRPG
jgi:hypothetical protein